MLPSLAVTLLLSIPFVWFLKHRCVYICVHTDMYIENCKYDKHEEHQCHFLRHNWLERIILHYMCVYIYIKSIMSLKNGACHVSCLQFCLFSLGLLHFFVLKRYLQIILKIFLLYCKLFIILNAFASSGASP